MTVGQTTRVCPDCQKRSIAMIMAMGNKRILLQCPKCSHQWWEDHKE